MQKTLTLILDWSEVWAPLIPLTIFLFLRPKAAWIKPVIIYLAIVIVLGIGLDIVWYRYKFGINDWVEEKFRWLNKTDSSGKIEVYNLIFYNLISFTRLILFTWFFHYLGKVFKKLNRFIPLLFLLFVIINFWKFENIRFDFSSRLFTVETAILLFYCLLYFYKINKDDSITSPLSLPHFWIVSGLTIYTAVNFFIFLFYKFLMTEYPAYAVGIWNVHNISYILLNIFISVALYKAWRNKPLI